MPSHRRSAFPSISQELTRNANRKNGTPVTVNSPTVKCPMVQPQRYIPQTTTFLCPTCSRYPASTPRTRVANLLGSFYELSTLKLIYTGCTAAYAAPCRTALSLTYLLIDVNIFLPQTHMCPASSRYTYAPTPRVRVANQPV